MTLHLTPESALALAMALHDPGYALEAKRKAAADTIEDLIAFLDETDGDPDLEDSGDEEDASWTEQHMGRHRSAGAASEDDEDGGDAEDCDPAEPTLGSPEMHIAAPAFGFMREYPRYDASRHPGGDQTHWGQGHNSAARDDCEKVNEDGGDINDEPHDRADEGNEEHSLCYNFGKGAADHEHDGPTGCGLSWDEAQAARGVARALLSRVGRQPARKGMMA